MRVVTLVICAAFCGAASAQLTDDGARAVRAHDGEVSFISATPRHVVTATAAGTVAVHALPGLEPIASIDVRDVVSRCTATADSILVATANRGVKRFTLPHLEAASASAMGRPDEVRWPAPLIGHFAPITDVALGGDLAATASWDGTLRIWDRSGRCRSYRDDVPPLTRIAFARIGEQSSVVGADVAGRVWLVPRVLRRDARSPATGATGCMAVSPDGLVATGSSDNVIRIFRRDGSMRVDEMNGAAVTSLQFIDENSMVSGDADGTFRSFAIDGDGRKAWDCGAPINSVAFFDRDTAAAGTRDHQVCFLADGKLEVRYEHADVVKWIAFSPDGERLASTSDDGAVKVWRRETGAVLLGQHPRAGHSVAWRPDGSHLASACLDGRIRIWDVRSGTLVKTHGPFRRGVNTARYDPTGERLVAASSDGRVTVIDAASGAVLGPVHEYDMATVDACFRGPDRVVAAHTDGAIVEIEWRNGKVLRRLGRTSTRVKSLDVVGPDAAAVVLASGRHAWWSAPVSLTYEEPGVVAEEPAAMSVELVDDGVVIARDGGAVKWIRCIPRRPRATAVTARHVVVGCDDGLLVILRREDGARLGEVHVEEAR